MRCRLKNRRRFSFSPGRNLRAFSLLKKILEIFFRSQEHFAIFTLFFMWGRKRKLSFSYNWMTVERWYDFAKTSMHGSERSDAGEKLGQELRSEKRQISFTNTAPTFSKKWRRWQAWRVRQYIPRPSPPSRASPWKFKNRNIITAPTFT